jgi:dolichyl-phosphate-mannose--protein O-mannosyl transferase
MIAPALVYMFCFLTCAVCAGLLVRSWLKTRTRLLLWIAISFVGLAVNNFFLFADMILVPGVDLSAVRTGTSLVSVSVLIIGLIWEAE